MRVSSTSAHASSQPSAQWNYHPYLPASPVRGQWLISDSSEESSGSAGDSIVSDEDGHPVDTHSGLQAPRRLILYPAPNERLLPSADEPGCPTFVQYLAVESSYMQDHAPARRQKALLSYESVCEIAQVLAQFNAPPENSSRHPTSTMSGIMMTGSMRHWARSKFTLSHEGVVLCKGKQVLVREQFYSALCWAHMQSGHGGRDKTSRKLWRYAGVPKELIMRFVASCPTCIDRTTARRGVPNMAVETEESFSPETTSTTFNLPSASLTLPPLRDVLSTIFGQGDQAPRHIPGVLDSPTNFSPVGSAFDEVRSPPQGHVCDHEGYNGVSLQSSSGHGTSLLGTLPTLQSPASQFGSSAPIASNFDAESNRWTYSLQTANDNEENADVSRISDESMLPSSNGYESSPYSQPPARDALMFAWSAAPMQRQAATEGVGLSPPSSPVMQRYTRLISPSFGDSPSATAPLLEKSTVTAGRISGWSPSTDSSSGSPASTRTPSFQSAESELYNTPLSRFRDRAFMQRWETMYATVNAPHHQVLPSQDLPESAEGDMAVLIQNMVTTLCEDHSAPNDVHAEESISYDAELGDARPTEMQFAALGFVHDKPLGRARAHSHSLGLALQTDFSADGAPTPPLTAASTLAVQSPVSPSLATPGHSLFMQFTDAWKSDGQPDAAVMTEPVDDLMVPWNEGFPVEHDPLAPHNVLHDWINMDYVDAGDMQQMSAGKQVALDANEFPGLQVM